MIGISVDGQGNPAPAAGSDQNDISPVIREGLQKNIPYISLGNIEIRSLLKTLAEFGQVSIIANKDVSGRMAIFLTELKNVTVGELLDMVLLANSLAMDIKGNVINITTSQEYLNLYGKNYHDYRQFKMIKLNHLKPSQFKSAVESQGITTPEKRTIIYDDISSHLIIIDFPDKIKRIETLVEIMDVPLVTKAFEFKYANVQTVASLLTTTKAITPDVSLIRIDARNHQIFVTDTVQNMDNVLVPLLSKLDTKQRQVLINTQMVQVELNDMYYLGVDWEKVFSTQSKLSGLQLVGKYPFPEAINSKPANNFSATYATIPTNNFTATLNALKGFGEVTTKSGPRLVTLNDTQAKFMVGRREAYVTTTTTNTQAGTTVSENVQFIDVGITLAVSPTINADNYITMYIKPEISDVPRREPTGQGNSIPIVQTTNVEVNVMIKDGVTIVIAGLIRDEKRHSESGIPVLKDFPIVGGLFRQTGDTQVKTETIIFLTPYIVSGDADTSVLTKQADMTQKQPKDVREIR